MVVIFWNFLPTLRVCKRSRLKCARPGLSFRGSRFDLLESDFIPNNSTSLVSSHEISSKQNLISFKSLQCYTSDRSLDLTHFSGSVIRTCAASISYSSQTIRVQIYDNREEYFPLRVRLFQTTCVKYVIWIRILFKQG